MKEFIVARKSIKSYMDSPITEEVNSINTTQNKQFLCLNKINDKKVAIIDDVISIGELLRSVKSLVEKVGEIVKANNKKTY